MEKKHPARRLALLAIALFGAIVWISQPIRDTRNWHGQEAAFELSIEASGSYDALMHDFAAVRDTLDFHLHQLAAHFPQARYRWETEGIDDERMAVFQSRLRLQFDDAGQRRDFLAGMLGSGRMSVELQSKDMTGLYGFASGDLPVAGNKGGLVHFEGWRFRLNMSTALDDLNA